MMRFDEIDELLELEEAEEIGILHYHQTRNLYKLQKRVNNFEKWNDIEFFNKFRMSKQSVLQILNKIENQIRHHSDRNSAILPLQQLLITLRFFVTGSFQNVLGDFGGLHRTTVGGIIRRVSLALAQLSPLYIYMPSTEQEKTNVKQQFLEISKFPRVIGAIDCTHVRIQNPGGEQGDVFRNRKGFYSINVQLICDAQNKIRDIVCKWPGSVYDSYIFRNSSIYMKFEKGEMGKDILLGDNGYPLHSYLITPIRKPQTPTEILFNSAHIKTRTVIEKTFGLLKQRFPILSLGMRNKLDTVLNIIVATAVLHNIACDNKDFLNDDEEEVDIQCNEDNINDFINDHYRQEFIDYFQMLL